MHGIIKSAAVLAAFLLATSAFAETRTIELPPFTALDVSSGIDAIVKVGGPQSITAEANDKRMLDDLQLDPSPFMQAFSWTHPEKAKEAIRKSGRLFANKSETEA